MLKIKVHIARILSLLVIFLISSNIGFTAYHFNPSLQKRITKEHSVSYSDHLQFLEQEDGEQIINLIKDQQEFDIDIECGELFKAIFHAYFLANDKYSGRFNYHAPELSCNPIWITNLQIRL